MTTLDPRCSLKLAAQSAVFPQELTWSRTHISNHMSRSCSGAESVWPELLLQSNIEQVSGNICTAGTKPAELRPRLYLQFDKVQESFLSLEQQISTFQAHLEGLGKASRDGPTGNLAHAKTTHLTGDAPVEARNSTSASASVPAAGADADPPRSALPFPSTIRRLHKSQRKK